MKKPSKQNPDKVAKQGWSFAEQVGYNQACEDWQSYHTWKMEQLPTEKEILDIIINLGKKSTDRYCDIDTTYAKISFEDIAQAIHKRIHKEKESKYQELIMAVGNKYKNETRHETALKYIKRAEQGCDIGGISRSNPQ